MPPTSINISRQQVAPPAQWAFVKRFTIDVIGRHVHDDIAVVIKLSIGAADIGHHDPVIRLTPRVSQQQNVACAQLSCAAGKIQGIPIKLVERDPVASIAVRLTNETATICHAASVGTQTISLHAPTKLLGRLEKIQNPYRNIVTTFRLQNLNGLIVAPREKTLSFGIFGSGSLTTSSSQHSTSHKSKHFSRHVPKVSTHAGNLQIQTFSIRA